MIQFLTRRLSLYRRKSVARGGLLIFKCCVARVKRINVDLILKARALQVSFRPRFALYRIVFVPAQKQNQFRMGHLFTHTNGDFGAISAIERRCAAPILKVESRISDRFSHHIRKLFLSAL